MWVTAEDGSKVFAAGRNAWELAANEALGCVGFSADDEDEWIADEPRSCYNCRYRRWTVESFACMKT